MHPKIAPKEAEGDISSNNDGEIGVTGGVERFLSAGGSVCGTHPASVEQEKRIRREVANSNERRRMQSINAGFLTLRAMLPQREGEKLSKAAILQQTSDFICNLEQEKTRLLTQNCQLKRLLGAQSGGESPDPAGPADSPAPPPPPPPQSVIPSSASQEEVSACDPPPAAVAPAQPPLQELRLELQELRAQLEQERLQRLSTEERLRQAEQEQQRQQRQQRVQVKFKRLRLDPAASPQLVMTERQVMTPPPPVTEEPPPPPPPVATRRPLYMGSTTSRQNLDTIVEAIRHLEGDHLFGDCSEPGQPRLEPAPAPVRLEPQLPTLMETIQTRLEPIQARLEPLPCIEAHLEPLHGRLELPQHSCLELEPQEAPLELTTHARSSSVDPYGRPAVIIAQHQPPQPPPRR